METIKREISIDKCISHKAGHLPFVRFNDGNYVYSGITSGNSNYGHFVCDLGVKNGNSNLKGECTYSELKRKSGMTIGDKWKVTNAVGRPNTIGYTPENTIYKWNGLKWDYYDKRIKYLDIIRKYNETRDILNNGILCKCVNSHKNGKILQKLDTTLYDMGCTDETIDDNIFNYKLLSKVDFETVNNINFLPKNNDIRSQLNRDKYILVDDLKTYEDNERWGLNNSLSLIRDGYYSTLIQCIEKEIIETNDISRKFHLLTPTVDLDIFFEEEYTPDALYYPYEYIVSGNEYKNIELNGESFSAVVATSVIDIYSIEDNLSTSGYSGQIITDLIKAESKLSELKHSSAIKFSNEHFGIMETWEDASGYTSSKLFKCIFYQETVGKNEIPEIKNENVYQICIIDKNISGDTVDYSWWECIPIPDNMTSAYTCADGEEVASNENKYRNISVLSSINLYVNEPSSGDVYNFYVYYQNGKINPINNIENYSDIKKISYPFKVGEPVNIELYENGEKTYDMVLSANVTTSGKCEIYYVLGATSGKPETGIFYEEILDYSSGITDNVFIDGNSASTLYYESLNYDSNITEYYNEELETNMFFREANIIKYTVGENLKYLINLPLFTREGTEKLYDEPNMQLDVSLNRGVSAAWEKHFKLSECNTFQDLKNYGNNVFNL